MLTADSDRRALADSAPDIIARFDRQRRISYINGAVADYLPRATSDLMGLSVDEAGFPAPVARIWSDALDAAVIECRATATEFEWETRRGRRYLHVRFVPDETGGAVAFVRDLSDSRLLAQARDAADDASEASGANYKFLAELLPQLVWSALPDGQVDYCNRNWVQYTGLDLVKSVGAGWTAALHPDDAQRTADRWLASVRTGDSYEVVYRLRRARDGAYRWFIGRALPMRDATGTIVRWMGTCTDIHEQKIAAEQVAAREAELSVSEARYRTESHINETLYRLGKSFAEELDHQKLVELITEEATKLTGAEIGAFFFNAVGADGQKYLLHTIAGAAKESFARFPAPRATPIFKPTFDGEGPMRLDDVTADPRFGQWGKQPPGHPKVTSYLAVPVVSRSGEVFGGLFFGHSEPARFTEQHERVMVGLSSQAAIALENARLYAALRESESKAREAEQRKDEFLAMLGHELRNPLAPIVTALQLMRLKGVGGEREREVIERQVEHMSQLVDDLLDVARVTRGKVELKKERVEASAVAARAIEMATPLLERRRHNLKLVVPRQGLPICADPVRMSQVLANLLTNAAKYTEIGGHIQLTAEAREGRVVFAVKDDGIGISRELLPKVFDMFVQGRQAIDRAEGGLGLGLTLVRSLVTLHEGEVEARSDGPGHGSEFIVRVPLALGSTEIELPRAAGPDAAAVPRRVLIVDDNVDLGEMIAELLATAGHAVKVVHDGPTALQVAPAFRPDVALLDIGLPVMDGYELATRLRGLLAGPVRLVALTGYGQDSDRQRAHSAGFDEHVVKPIDPDHLQALVGAD